MESNNQSSFWQFSDNLRLQNNNFSNLSLNDSIWSTSYASNKQDRRNNFDFKNGAVSSPVNDLNQPISFVNEIWKNPNNDNIGSNFNYPVSGSGINGGFNKGVYSNNSTLNVNGYSKGKSFVGNFNGSLSNKNVEGYVGNFGVGAKIGKKGNKGNKENGKGSDGNENNKSDKRFKSLPPAESLPRNETIGGYIFVCNNDTMSENLKRQLFGLPPRYRDSVRTITPGLPLFLYNYSTHQLHGIFEAASFGGANIDPSAWEDKKNPGESRFPAQVRVVTRKICEPMEEDAFRPVLHHYDGPKFRLELSVPEALSLLDIFAENQD